MPNQSPTADGQNVMGKLNFYRDASGVAQPSPGGTAADPVYVATTGPSSDPAAGIAPVKTTVSAYSLQLKTGAGNFYGLSVYASVAGFFLLYDAAAVPADGAQQPLWQWQVGAGQSNDISEPAPIAFTTGAVLVFSTTGPFLKTIGLAGTVFMSGLVK